MSVYSTLLSAVKTPFRTLGGFYDWLNSKGMAHGGALAILSLVIGVLAFLGYDRLVSNGSDDLSASNVKPEEPVRPHVQDPDPPATNWPETTPEVAPFDAQRLDGVWEPEKRLLYGTVHVANGKGVLVDDRGRTVLEFGQLPDGSLVGRVLNDSSRSIDVILQPNPEYGLLVFVPIHAEDGDAFHWSWAAGTR